MKKKSFVLVGVIEHEMYVTTELGNTAIKQRRTTSADVIFSTQQGRIITFDALV